MTVSDGDDHTLSRRTPVGHEYRDYSEVVVTVSIALRRPEYSAGKVDTTTAATYQRTTACALNLTGEHGQRGHIRRAVLRCAEEFLDNGIPETAADSRLGSLVAGTS